MLVKHPARKKRKENYVSFTCRVIMDPLNILSIFFIESLCNQ